VIIKTALQSMEKTNLAFGAVGSNLTQKDFKAMQNSILGYYNI